MIETTQFSKKLNKLDGKIYVVEEEIWMPEGSIYEAELQHDNVNMSTFAVYTGPKLTGEKILSYVLSTPSLTPWKSIIRVQTDIKKIYISYETDGDIVEADDINKLQDSIEITQKGLNIEEDRAINAEKGIHVALLDKVDKEDGKKLSSNDYSDDEKSIVYDVNTKKHVHGNETILDKITQLLVDRWTSAFEHMNDVIKHIPSGGSSGQVLKRDAEGKAVWGMDNNVTYAPFKGATASVNGKEGLVPVPPSGSQRKYLRADGGWEVPESEYTHPNSGVSAGAYKQVTVDSRGHVTAGTNPTTLEGYGITNAAAANHNHDGVYLKQGNVTWNHLKGG